ncbi:hypothetical protein KDAU_64380 [Dictyobacter aurantiacus]|uniref:Uncharacterized protein n=1 Tax=Dictyobacter aurantiacus TaxID=1936993 RepID=A0A401ZQH0_9CHLR|nr:hypothetical protein KDAU_64380 [Dictyobacter aurantiacus]
MSYTFGDLKETIVLFSLSRSLYFNYGQVYWKFRNDNLLKMAFVLYKDCMEYFVTMYEFLQCLLKAFYPDFSF